jgi:hypothetical protein
MWCIFLPQYVLKTVMLVPANICTLDALEDGALALKHVGILYLMYDFTRFLCVCWLL